MREATQLCRFIAGKASSPVLEYFTVGIDVMFLCMLN